MHVLPVSQRRASDACFPPPSVFFSLAPVLLEVTDESHLHAGHAAMRGREARESHFRFVLCLSCHGLVSAVSLCLLAPSVVFAHVSLGGSESLLHASCLHTRVSVLSLSLFLPEHVCDTVS